MRNVTLMEARAEKRQLDEHARQHRATCPRCGLNATTRRGCTPRQVIDARRATLADQIAGWFIPGPDQEVMF